MFLHGLALPQREQIAKDINVGYDNPRVWYNSRLPDTIYLLLLSCGERSSGALRTEQLHPPRRVPGT